MSEQLNPCPFCERPPVPTDIMQPAMLSCTYCGCSAYRANWNNRPIEDKLRAEIAALRESMKTLAAKWHAESASHDYGTSPAAAVYVMWCANELLDLLEQKESEGE